MVFVSTSARLLVGVTTTITVASDITSSSVKSDHECKRRNAELAAPRLLAVQLTREHEHPGIVEADLRCRRTRLIREGCPTRHAKGFPDRSPRLRSRPRPPNGRRSQGRLVTRHASLWRDDLRSGRSLIHGSGNCSTRARRQLPRACLRSHSES